MSTRLLRLLRLLIDYQWISKITGLTWIIPGLPRLFLDYQDYSWITKIIPGLPRLYLGLCKIIAKLHPKKERSIKINLGV